MTIEPGLGFRRSCSAKVPPVRGPEITSGESPRGKPEITQGVCHRPQETSPLTAQSSPDAAASRALVQCSKGVKPLLVTSYGAEKRWRHVPDCWLAAAFNWEKTSSLRPELDLFNKVKSKMSIPPPVPFTVNPSWPSATPPKSPGGQPLNSIGSNRLI